jgi:hypothetical protein
MGASGQLHAPGRLTPWRKTPGTHLIESLGGGASEPV